VCETFLSETSVVSSSPVASTPTPRTFVYISAEDVFRPVIPTRYITTKREAEQMIIYLCENASPAARGVFMRPSM